VLMLPRYLQSNFFTLSSFGVTHFLNGKPEFSELEQWKREVGFFVVLRGVAQSLSCGNVEPLYTHFCTFHGLLKGNQFTANAD